jgi:hypothetical protein
VDDRPQEGHPKRLEPLGTTLARCEQEVSTGDERRTEETMRDLPEKTLLLAAGLSLLAMASCGVDGSSGESPLDSSVAAVASGNTFGNTSPGAPLAASAVNLERVVHFVAPATGTATSLSLYVGGTGASGQETVRGVIYSDSGGAPSGLLGSTAEITVNGSDAASWRTISFSAGVPITAGASYWFGAWAGGAAGAMQLYGGSCTACRQYANFPYSSTGSPMNPWSGGTVDGLEFAFYVSYTPAGNTFGNTSPGAPLSASAVNLERVVHFVAPATGTATSLSMYVGGTGATGQETVRGVLYSDSGGAPSGLLGTTSEITVNGTDAASWRTISFTAGVPITAGASYWFGAWAGGTAGAMQLYGGSCTACRQYTTFPYSSTGSPMSPWSGGTVDGLEFAFYVTYTTTTSVPSVNQWSAYTVPLTSATTYADPYTDVTVTATFTGPGGVTKQVQGFWDGANQFDVRFAPPLQGSWSYTITSSPADSGLTQSGSLDVVAPAPGSHGFLRRDPANPYSFVFDDQTRFFVMGQTYYGIIQSALDDGTWQQAISQSKAYGFSKIRLLLFDWTSAPYGHPYSMPFTTDHDHLNLPYWQKMDQVISTIQSAGMIADLILFADDPAIWGTSTQNDRYLRYALARYGSFENLTWCVSNEWNYTNQPQSEFDHLGGILAAEDPNAFSGTAQRALSVHQQTRIDFQFFGSTWPAHAIIQYGPRNGLTLDGDAWGNAGILYNRGHDMPIVDDEYGYIDPNDVFTLDDGTTFSEDRTTIRNAVWGLAMAGGYGTFGGDNTYLNASNQPILSGDWLDQPGPYGDIQRLVSFWTTQGIPYWEMTPNNSLTSSSRTYVLEDPAGTTVVAYKASNGSNSFSLTLPSGTYSVFEYDALDGTTNTPGNFVSTGGAAQFVLPTTDDWAVLFRRVGSSSPISYVQGNGWYDFTTATSSFSLALPSAVTAGDTIIVSASWDPSQGSVSQVTDTEGNGYALAVASPNGDSAIYYAKNARPGSTTVTMTFTGATQGVFYVHEYAGLSTSAPLDATSAASGTAASFDAGAKATSFPNELIFGYANVAYKATAGSSFNVRRTDGGNVSEDMFVSSTGTYDATFGQTEDGVPTSGGYSALMATFH